MEENSLELMELIEEFLRDEFGEKFLCHICGETCSSLELHLECHKCLFCTYTCDMNDHLSWHTRDIVDFDFPTDFRGFLGVTEVEKFFKATIPQTKQDVTQCEICGKFLLKSSIGSHIRIKHSSEKPFVCEKCGKKYKSRGSLKIHENSHEDRRKSLTCDQCGSSFFAHKALLAHIRRLHKTCNILPCPACGKSFRTPNDLRYHREVVHLTVEKKFKCNICCLPFKGLQGLRRHKARHREDEIFHHICQFCEAKFSEEAPFKRHEENCSGHMNYECKFCSEKFSTYVRLRGHRRKSHQEKIRKRKSRK